MTTQTGAPSPYHTRPQRLIPSDDGTIFLNKFESSQIFKNYPSRSGD